MPKALGKVISRKQAAYLQEMLRKWERDSGTMLARMKTAIETRLARDPRKLASDVEAIGAEMAAFAEKLVRRRDATSGPGRRELDDVLELYGTTYKALTEAVDAARDLADGRATSSSVAEKMNDLHERLTLYRKASDGYRVKMELHDMVSDELAEALKPPSAAKVDLVDFAKSLEMSHRGDEYSRLASRLPAASSVERFELIRFPVVPVTEKMAKASSFGDAAEVDPVTFRDAQGKMRVRYLVFKHQLVMAANSRWLDSQAKARRIRRARDIAKFVQSQMDAMTGHAALVSSPSESAARARERILAKRLVSLSPSAHRKAPGMTFYWFAPAKDAYRILQRTRQVKAWSLALV